ncbi:hypothetical protein [Virgisporangium aurantiacum]|uniref:Uncharacterized protein n=1 Tax=Virgisporangium aurantiacum TaxID=175570 RepID=A0A8J3Z6K5_9ACTN|nr:hypothetical protein [Virgisporangium aurantiacum]GIJ56205.1 hypothetical protein Vau01_037210 [Virgisporangium aurantiacum]
MRPIDMSELVAGAQWWRATTTWRKDFHNADYRTLAAENPHGAFLDDWWAGFLPRLAAWKALRPVPHSEVTARLLDNREDLAAAWHQVCVPVRDDDIAAVTWGQVRGFPEIVARLKPTQSRSPVFASKFCHFLLPRIFPVVDSWAVSGAGTYEGYFTLIKETWEATPVDLQTRLIAGLTCLVEDGGDTLFRGFPYATKITELALIGRKHARRA